MACRVCLLVLACAVGVTLALQPEPLPAALHPRSDAAPAAVAQPAEVAPAAEPQVAEAAPAATAPVIESPPAAKVAPPAPTTSMAQAGMKLEQDAPTCTGKKCKPAISKSCKGKVDGCRVETECCEIDKCNIWQHVGRDVATVLVFYATWCPVSRDFMLPYDLLRREYEPYDNVLVAKVDVDANPNLVADFGIEEYPSIVFFRRDCYWSGQGCYDPMVFRRYNGTTNEYEYVDAWIKEQLALEQNDNAFKVLPAPDESETPCKVSKPTRPPEDMRGTFNFPSDEGAQALPPLPAQSHGSAAIKAIVDSDNNNNNNNNSNDSGSGSGVVLVQESEGVRRACTAADREAMVAL